MPVEVNCQLELSDILTVKALAEILGISENAVQKRASRGELPSYRLHRRLYFNKQEILKHVFDPINYTPTFQDQVKAELKSKGLTRR